MKKLIKILFGIVVILFLLSSNTLAQKKLYLSTGVGYPELLNAGMGLKLGQTKLRATYGAIESSTSVSGDIIFMSAREDPMFFKIGVSKLESESKLSIDKYVYLNLRIGKEWNMSKNFGVALDAGLSIVIIHDEIRKTPKTSSFFSFDFLDFADFPFPTASLMLFYRI
jgi:hypothetical protein